MTAAHLVFTDLDGSLLDHDSYSYEAARPVLELLESLRIPVVMVSSKTRAEIEELRQEMGNEHPFIVENGAAVYLPRRYFLTDPSDCEPRDGYLARSFAPPRAHWSAVLGELQDRWPGEFQDFSGAGAQGVAEMTGLPLSKARLANEREYSEPVQWRGGDENLEQFLRALRDAGARVQRGGRFYSVGGHSDKGAAVQWLRERYALAAGASAVYDLAIGDGQNDVPMLEVTHRALLIPARGRDLPQLTRKEGVLVGEGFGPEAWSAGVRDWLRELYTLAKGD